jgi:hypothetical protein
LRLSKFTGEVEQVYRQEFSGGAQDTLTPALSLREREIGGGLYQREGNKTDSGYNAVVAIAELGEHRAGVGFVARFTEDKAVALGDGVGGEDD